MAENFRKIRLSDSELLTGRTCENHLGWEYDFGMIWVWDVFDSIMLAETDFGVIVRTRFNNKTVFYPPYVRSGDDYVRAVKFISKACKNEGVPLRINGICENEVQYFDETFSISADRNNFDYIYLTDDLINLSGKKYHAKRNYVTRFESTYSHSFDAYTPADRGGLLALFDKWHVSAGHETLDLERLAIERALDYAGELNLRIGVLRADGKIVAYSVSSVQSPVVAHTFFEKGDTDFVGVYQAINKYIAAEYLRGCKYVNRQEDMGIEGLRKVKLSYHPYKLLTKYSAVECES